MTKVLEEAIETARELSDEAQDELALALFAFLAYSNERNVVSDRTE